MDVDCTISFCCSRRRQQRWNIGRSLLGFILENLALHIEVIYHSPTDVCHSEIAPDWIIIVYNAQSNLQALEGPDSHIKGHLTNQGPNWSSSLCILNPIRLLAIRTPLIPVVILPIRQVIEGGYTLRSEIINSSAVGQAHMGCVFKECGGLGGSENHC